MRDLTQKAGAQRPFPPGTESAANAAAQTGKYEENRDEARDKARGDTFLNARDMASGKRRRQRARKSVGLKAGSGNKAKSGQPLRSGQPLQSGKPLQTGKLLQTEQPQRGAKVVALAARADGESASSLLAKLLDNRGYAVVLNIGGVEQISALTLEVIIAAARQWAADALPFALFGTSAAFDLACNRLGLEAGAPWISAGGTAESNHAFRFGG